MTNTILKLFKQIVIRSYTLVILLVLVWTGYTAVTYLFRSVFYPTQVPAWFLDWRGHLEADALQAGEIAGVTRSAPRAPLNHFHGVDRWFQPDPHNNCTISGCHNSLPHNNVKEIRAFANFHTTFLACDLCHDKRVSSPARAEWISMHTGKHQDPPALLMLMRLLEINADKIQNNPAAVHREIKELLKQTLRVMEGNEYLQHLATLLDTSEPGSPVWRLSVAQLKMELPLHARGEYGAKIGPVIANDNTDLTADQMADLTARYLAAIPESPEQKELHDRIHESILEKPAACTTCHGDVPERIDFASLGYPPSQADHIKNITVAKQVQQTQQGQPFYLPRLLEGGYER